MKYCPTDGTPSLKKAIIRYTEEHYDKVVAPENVIVSAGAKQSIFNVLYTLLNPQDEVMILAPYWVSYPEMVKMVYGVPVIVTPEDGSFQPADGRHRAGGEFVDQGDHHQQPEQPERHRLPAKSSSRQIVDFCERKKIYLIMDDIYHKLVFDGTVAPPAYRFTTKDLEDSRLIVINGIAKLYGMTGFRIGWCVAPRKLVDVIMTNVQAQTTSCASPVMQAGAEGALLGLQSFVESLRLHDPEQPRHRHAGALVVQRREDAQARRARSTACPTSGPTAATRWNCPSSS